MSCKNCSDCTMPLDDLEQLEATLYKLHHICALLGDFAGQSGREFTDGIQLEHYAVVFGFISDEIHDARLRIAAIDKARAGVAA